MDSFKDLIGQVIDLQISGKKYVTGTLVDTGPDLLVIFSEQQFLYIPLVHVQDIAVHPDTTFQPTYVPDSPIDSEEESMSYRKILLHAKGYFLEIYVTGNKAIHGYLTSTMNDYFVFHSPVYGSMFVSMNHVKWIIPYSSNNTPYSLDRKSIPFTPPPTTLARTFKEQCKKLQGNLVAFDMGDDPNKIGLLETVHDASSMLTMVTANGTKLHRNLQHLKTVNVVNMR